MYHLAITKFLLTRVQFEDSMQISARYTRISLLVLVVMLAVDSLSHHFGLCSGERENAFKYAFKAAELALSCKAYGKTYAFLVKALGFASDKHEFKSMQRLLETIVDQVHNMQQQSRVNHPPAPSTGRNTFIGGAAASSGASSTPVPTSGLATPAIPPPEGLVEFNLRINSFLKLKADVDKAYHNCKSAHITTASVASLLPSASSLGGARISPSTHALQQRDMINEGLSFREQNSFSRRPSSTLHPPLEDHSPSMVETVSFASCGWRRHAAVAASTA